MITNSRVLPETTRRCPGNLGTCGARLFKEDESLVCIAGHRWAYVSPFPLPTRYGTGPKHNGIRMT